jgi:beta-N-acetylhexosaminidase
MSITKMKTFFSKAVFCLVALGFSLRVDAQETDSLDIKIGQMILIGFPGPTVDAKVLDEVRAGKVGSIIIFEKNIPAANSFIALKKITWTYQHASPIPLFICIDQEGGRVNRLKDKYGFPRSITAAAMGRAGTLDSVRFYAEATAATLAGLGINFNFAPVVDLASNPDNPIIARYGRAFSANEDSVTLLAKEFIKAHRKFNVLTSLKHFPGHGSSKADTHLGMADVTDTWEPRELTPYRILIDSGCVDAVMSAHIVNRKLDAEGNPGTLSKSILTGILRDKLGFSGVVFSDDMQMHAITEHYGLEEAIRLAIGAGIDIMTFSNNISGSDERTVDKVHAVIRDMVEKRVITEARIDESFNRIMNLKRQLASGDRTAVLTRELESAREALERADKVLRDSSEPLRQQGIDKPEIGTKKSRKKNKDL